MKGTARDYIEIIRKPEHTEVVFRYDGYGDYAHMEIEKFLYEFGHRKVSLNGDFYDSEGKIMRAFIMKTI